MTEGTGSDQYQDGHAAGASVAAAGGGRQAQGRWRVAWQPAVSFKPTLGQESIGGEGAELRGPWVRVGAAGQ